jgi:hypothetical protein
MTELRNRLAARASDYAQQRGRSLMRFLGEGNDGAVWESDQQTAIKVLERRNSFLREKETYLRLQELGIVEIRGFAVPILVDIDDTRQIVEMTVVFPPCILDFAKAYLDRPPDFPAEVIRDWREQTADLFDDDWDNVESLLHELRLLGVFYFDAKPGNIRTAT